MVERARKFDPTTSALLRQVVEIQATTAAVAQEEAEAAELVPGLKKRIDDFVLKLFPESKKAASPKRKRGEAIPEKELREISKRAVEDLRAPHGMQVECEVPLGDASTKVTITRGTNYYDMFDRNQDVRVNVEALPDILVFGQSSGAWIQSKARNRAEFTRDTPIGPGGNLDRGPVSSRTVNKQDIADYSGLFDVLKSSRVKKTPSRFHQQRPF